MNGGINMKKMELFYFLFAVLMLFIFAAPVSATDLDATTCIGTGWSWDAGTNNCTVSGDVYISDVTIPAGTTLYINNLGNFYTNATITNFGTINNVGIINIVGTIINKCGGTFTNSGNFLGNPVQYESCTPPSIMDLNESTCIDIIGGYWISNICTVNASYNVSSGITLNINNGITLQISGILGNFGTININDGGIFENLGNVYNQGTIFNACGGTFTNSGTFDGVPVQYELCTEPTPAQNIQNLINDVENLNLQHGIENSLVAKLNAAMQKIQANNNAEAINSLQAFINEVMALRGKKIPEGEADKLIADAQAIILQLTGS